MTSVLIFSDNESSSGTKEQEEIGIQPDFVTHVDIRATELAAMPVPTPRTIQPTDAESCTPGLDIDQTQQPQERSSSNFPSMVHLWQTDDLFLLL